MRVISHSTVVLLVLAATFVLVDAREPGQRAYAESTFTIFFRGTPIGNERVSLTGTTDGWTISASGRLDAPINFVTRRLEMHYDSEWRPRDLLIEASEAGQPLDLRTTFTTTSAENALLRRGEMTKKTDTVSAATVVLLDNCFACYEALVAKLVKATPGADIRVYVAPQAEIAVRLTGAFDERIRTPKRVIEVRRHQVRFLNPERSFDAEIWSDENERLLRVSLPHASLEFIRDDIVSVETRRELIARTGDEDVRITASGFTIAATLSRPNDRALSASRLPAVILVAGSEPLGRDELAPGIPIFGQIAGALADAGFLVVRYDKRGVGQSGGRAEAVTLGDYATDVRSVVRYLAKRKDVDTRRIAVLGHGEGGWIGLSAASGEKQIATLVLVATPGVPGTELTLEQQRHALDRTTLSDADKNAKIELQKTIQNAVVSGKGWEAVPAELRRQADTPWFQSLLTFDPSRPMRATRQPLLIVHGALDRSVPAYHAERLAELARKRRNPAPVDVITLPGLNHLLLPASTGEADEYSNLVETTVSREFTSAVAEWLQKTFQTGSR